MCIRHVNACERRLHAPSHLDLGFSSREYLAQSVSRAKAVNTIGAPSVARVRVSVEGRRRGDYHKRNRLTNLIRWRLYIKNILGTGVK